MELCLDENLKIRLVKHAGRSYLDIRRYFTKPDSSQSHPSKEGIRVSTQEIENVLGVLDLARAGGMKQDVDQSPRAYLAHCLREQMNTWVKMECGACMMELNNLDAHLGNSCMLPLADQIKFYMDRLLTEFNIEEHVSMDTIPACFYIQRIPTFSV